MRFRYTAGILTLGGLTLVGPAMLASTAAADTDLAPGVHCTNAALVTCTNDNDQSYVIHAVGICTRGTGPSGILPVQFNYTVVASPHESAPLYSVSGCPHYGVFLRTIPSDAEAQPEGAPPAPAEVPNSDDTTPQ